MLRTRISQPASSRVQLNSDQRPAKRLKTGESLDSDEQSCSDTSDRESLAERRKIYRDEIPNSEEDNGSDEEARYIDQAPTELESTLPPVRTDKEAIAEYESMRAVGEDIPLGLRECLKARSWVKGTGSIYVDAFNLALETVLEDEGHLFDEAETEVFNQWKALDYEAQYLSVKASA